MPLEPSDMEVSFVSQTGLPWSLIREIALRRIDDSTGGSIADVLLGMGASAELSKDIERCLRRDNALKGQGLNYEHFLVQNALSIPGYRGILPVSLESWQIQADYNNIHNRFVEPDLINKHFSDMQGLDALIATLADLSGQLEHILMSGPEELGYSLVAERLASLHQDSIAIPAAVAVGRHILTVYDPQVHVPQNSGCIDPRYISCKRPYIAVTTAETSLQTVHIQNGSGRAPLGMIANGGVLLVSMRNQERAPKTGGLLDLLLPLGGDHQEAYLDKDLLRLSAGYCVVCEMDINAPEVMSHCKASFGLHIPLSHPEEFEASLELLSQMRQNGLPADKATVIAFLTEARRIGMEEIPRATIHRIVKRASRINQLPRNGPWPSGELIRRAWAHDLALSTRAR